jgi:hypothetical protein
VKRTALIVACSALGWGVAHANDFPTAERVQYVFECMRERPGVPHYEMVYKCSCAIDAIAEQLPYDEYVELWTASRGITIAGERGAELRDSQDSRDMAKKFRDIDGQAQKKCFLRKEE